MNLRVRLVLFLSVLCLLAGILPAAVRAEDSFPDLIEEEISLDEEPAEEEVSEPADPTARDAFIDDIIALGQKLYKKASGKAQRAQYKSDI